MTQRARGLQAGWGVERPCGIRIAECRLRVPHFLSPINNSKLETRNSKLDRKGQSTLEYAVLVGVIAAALVAMQLYVRRSIQANLKTLENQINAEAM